MLRQRAHVLRSVLMAGDAAAMGVAFVAAYHVAGPLTTRWLGLKNVLPIHRYLWVLAVGVPMAWVLFAYFGSYDLARLERWIAGVGRLVMPLFLHGVLLAALVFFAKEELFARRVIGVLIAFDFLAVAVGRGVVMWVALRTGRSEERLRRILLVGGGQGARRFLEWVRGSGWGISVVGALAEPDAGLDCPVLGPLSAVGEVLDREVVDDVVVAEPPRDLGELRRVIQKCEEVGCIVHILSDFFEAALSRPHVESFGGMSFLTFTRTPYAPALLAAKRLMDVVGAAALLTVTGLPMAALLLGMRLTSRGRAIFAQQRVGLNGRLFTMYKIRSMVEDAEAMRAELDALNETDGPTFKIADDPRLTRLGRVLRRFSLDELPQLWNVLRGDMSLVGPRPPLPSEVSRYERWQRRRLSMRPGMTGLWQIRGRHRTGFDAWMRHDLEYIDNWSIALDLKIMLRTIPVILSGRGV